MPRFNTPTAHVSPRSPVTTEAAPSGLTHEGGPGYARGAKSELFLLAVTHMGDGSFYESAAARNSRFSQLVSQVAVADPDWISGFIPWLRDEAAMRTASTVAAAEAARALEAAGQPGGRQVIARSLRRADEPGELVAYWHSLYGRKLPKPVKRGLADASVRLYDEFSVLRYDTDRHAIRFADVLDLTHPRPADERQDQLFRFTLDRRHGHLADDYPLLAMVRSQRLLRAEAAEDPSVLLDAERLRQSGMTWEDALSLAGTRLDKALLWAALLPSMGVMAIARNLRNIDQAGVPDAAAAVAIAKLTDPDVIRRSRMFPFRFLAAHQHAPSLRWAYPLELALGHSMANVPQLDGRTLILVDRSGSMFDRVSAQSELNRADSAALFGSALAMRCKGADLVQFGTGSEAVHFGPGESVLKVVGRFRDMGGTNTAAAVRAYFHGHNRVVILTDEQTFGGYYGASPTEQIPAHVPVYTWNLAGYSRGHGPSGSANRHTFGGLSDASFRLIPMLEAHRDAAWPWEAGAVE